MEQSYYSEARRLLTMTEVLQGYGVQVKRGFALCPFHQEGTPSMKVYPDSFHCFGCGKGGDAVEFVSLYFGLQNHEALAKLNEDFRLGLPLDRPIQKAERRNLAAEKRKRERERQAVQERLQALCKRRREIWMFVKKHRPESDKEAQMQAGLLAELDKLDYLIETTNQPAQPVRLLSQCTHMKNRGAKVMRRPEWKTAAGNRSGFPQASESRLYPTSSAAFL